jgi:hypothetical protein
VPHRKQHIQQFFYYCVCLLAMIVFLSRYHLSMIGGCMDGHTDWWKGIMKFGIGMSFGAIIHIVILIKIWLSCSKVQKFLPSSSVHVFNSMMVQWLRLALSQGPNRVGVSFPVIEVSSVTGTEQSRCFHPHTWGRKQIQFPKHCVF